jgi:hypothetical protein
MVERGLSERRALTVAGVSASSLYVPAPDRNSAMRARIVALAHRHRRYGVGMIYLKLRQAGERVNHKRLDRLSAAERLQVRRRRRKEVPVADRVLKCLAIVDDATTEAVATVPGRSLGGPAVTRVLDRLAVERGLPTVLRTDNALEFCGRVMLTWAQERGDTSTDRTREAEPERVHRIVQWPVPR